MSTKTLSSDSNLSYIFICLFLSCQYTKYKQCDAEILKQRGKAKRKSVSVTRPILLISFSGIIRSKASLRRVIVGIVAGAIVTVIVVLAIAWILVIGHRVGWLAKYKLNKYLY